MWTSWMSWTRVGVGVGVRAVASCWGGPGRPSQTACGHGGGAGWNSMLRVTLVGSPGRNVSRRVNRCVGTYLRPRIRCKRTRSRTRCRQCCCRVLGGQ